MLKVWYVNTRQALFHKNGALRSVAGYSWTTYIKSGDHILYSSKILKGLVRFPVTSQSPGILTIFQLICMEPILNFIQIYLRTRHFFYFIGFSLYPSTHKLWSFFRIQTIKNVNKALFTWIFSCYKPSTLYIYYFLWT